MTRKIPESAVKNISAQIEKRKVLDYEIIQEEDEWEREENNEEETEEKSIAIID